MVKIPENLEAILEKSPNYVVYVLKCKVPEYYYVGYTNDFRRRIKEHESGNGAEFTKFYGVESVLYLDPNSSKEVAMKRETLFTLYCISKLYPKYREKSIDHVGGGKYPGVIKSLSERIEILKTLRNYMDKKSDVFN